MHQNLCRQPWMISLNAFFLCISQAFSRHWEQSSVAACPCLGTCSSTDPSLATPSRREPAHFAEPIQTNSFSLFLVELTLAAFALLSLAFCYQSEFCSIPTIIIFSGSVVPMPWIHLLPSFQFPHLSSNGCTLYLLLFQLQPLNARLSTFVDTLFNPQKHTVRAVLIHLYLTLNITL